MITTGGTMHSLENGIKKKEEDTKNSNMNRHIVTRFENNKIHIET